MMRDTPPFRADHVGSLLRPPRLLQARDDYASGKLDAAGLLAECRQRLPAFMVPARIIERRTSLPRNPNGKIDRKALPAALARLERALASSPADATELIWVEARRGQESNGKRRRDSYELQERMVLARVRESGRCGTHRTSGCEVSDLEGAIRQAMADSFASRGSSEYREDPITTSPLAAWPQLI